MKTIVINNQKGGVGKTMLAVHLAWFLAEEEGVRVLFVDLDGQGNSSEVLKHSHRAGLASDLFDTDTGKALPFSEGPGINVLIGDPELNSVEISGVTPMIRRFAKLQESFDYCVIDTPPAWGPRNFAAMAVSDGLIAPVELRDFSMQGVAQLLHSLKAVEDKGRQGRKINFLGLLPSRFDSHSPLQKSNLMGLVEKLDGKLMFRGIISQRDGYEQAMQDSRPVWTIKKTAAVAAGAEMRTVAAAIRDKMMVTSKEAAL